jgi:signal transduction histidine kinase
MAAWGVLLGAPPGESHGTLLSSVPFALAAAALAAVPLTLLLARSLLSPLEELLRATERIGAGDYRHEVLQVSSDEYGELARSLNTAMAGLAERAALAAEVRASRARIVAASDAERRRIERNIHDGAQQRLVALTLDLGLIEELAGEANAPELQRAAAAAARALKEALAELRELARGLHPSVLATDGLQPALAQLAARSPVPVDLDIAADRFPETVESTAFFVAAEALTNVARYARAKSAEVTVTRRDTRLVVTVADDGVGGARAAPGSGLAGLADRVAALDGTLRIDSPPDGGTRVTAELPLRAQELRR